MYRGTARRSPDPRERHADRLLAEREDDRVALCVGPHELTSPGVEATASAAASGRASTTPTRARSGR